MVVDRDTKGRLYYQYTTRTEDAPTMKGVTVNLPPSDVLHIPGLGFDELISKFKATRKKGRHPAGSTYTLYRWRKCRNQFPRDRKQAPRSEQGLGPAAYDG